MIPTSRVEIAALIKAMLYAIKFIRGKEMSLSQHFGAFCKLA